MDNTIAPGGQKLSPDMTVLDVVSRHDATQKVFKDYNTKAGECICCQSLFETLETVAEKYDLNLKKFMADLAAAVD
jgi:hypothetical protein